MKKILLIYGLLMAFLVGLLKVLDYRYLVKDFSWEAYVGIISLIFTILGIWIGLKLTARSNKQQHAEDPPLSIDETPLLAQSGLSKREYEVLQLLAQGLSNQEIADQLFISLNTVKTHTSSLYHKLEVKRRTQAVQQAKVRGLLP